MTGPKDTAPTEDYLDFFDGRVHLLRAGSGTPVLFLHAGGGGGWHPFLDLLARRFEVFAPDHPGFGESDELPEVEGVDDLVYHYLDLIEQLGLERPHVVGGSFGGWVGAELAVAAPHAIGSLVLMGAAGLRLPDHPVTDLFFLPPGQIPGALYHQPAKIPPGSGEPDIDAVIAGYRDATAFARFSWVPFLNNPKLERRLRRVTAPTLVVWAANDRVVPIEHGRRYAERIPNARELKVVDDCGHAMYFERPEEFAQLTADFLTPG